MGLGEGSGARTLLLILGDRRLPPNCDVHGRDLE